MMPHSREDVDGRKRPRECAKVQIPVDLGNMQPRHLFFYKICSAGKDIM